MRQLTSALRLLKAFASFVSSLPLSNPTSADLNIQHQWQGIMLSCLQPHLPAKQPGHAEPPSHRLSNISDTGKLDADGNTDSSQAAAANGQHPPFGPPGGRADDGMDHSAHSIVMLVNVALHQLSLACQCLAYLGFMLHHQLVQQRKQKQLQQLLTGGRPTTPPRTLSAKSPAKRASWKSQASPMMPASRSLSMSQRFRESIQNRRVAANCLGLAVELNSMVC